MITSWEKTQRNVVDPIFLWKKKEVQVKCEDFFWGVEILGVVRRRYLKYIYIYVKISVYIYIHIQNPIVLKNMYEMI